MIPQGRRHDRVWQIEIELRPNTDRPVADFAVRLSGQVVAPTKEAAGAQVVVAFADFIKALPVTDSPIVKSATAVRLKGN